MDQYTHCIRFKYQDAATPRSAIVAICTHLTLVHTVIRNNLS